MKLERWVSDIATAAAAFEGSGVLDIRQPGDAGVSKTVSSGGFPGVLPLWTGRLQTIGLFANPEASPDKWPAVILSRGQGLTLASDATTLLPQLIVQRVLSNLPEATERFAERWKTIEAITVALHRVLGGDESALAEVVSVVRDPKQRAVFDYEERSAPAFEAAHSRLERKVDHSESFTRYADWFDACIKGQYAAPADPDGYGSWARRVLCWANRLASRQQPPLKPSASVLDRVIAGHAGIDSGLPVKASWSARPGAASGEAALLEAAEQLRSEAPSGDPERDGLRRAILEGAMSYQGYAHAEAAAALDEHGEPVRAWEALQSAAWWAARNAGHVPAAIMDAARSLAERHKWPDVAWVVDRAK